MTDRELLEMAAKAAGILCTVIDLSNSVPVGTNEYNEIIFDPLTDDGDALRLAVKLYMQVECSKGYQHVSVYGRDFTISELHDGREPEAATRRAIVRAAAEIGRS